MIEVEKIVIARVRDVKQPWFSASFKKEKGGCTGHGSGPTPKEALRSAMEGIDKAQKVFDSFK